MKKFYFIALTIFLTLAILIGLYFIQYPTKVDKLSLESELQKFEEIKDIRVQNVKVIDNKIIALYTYDNGIGYGTFIKGFNGRCLLTESYRDVGSIAFQEGQINTNKGNYSLFAGKNYDKKIKLIELISEDGKRSTHDISKENYFIITIGNTSKVFSFFKFDLYDESGESIKNEIFQKHLKNHRSSQLKAKAELELFNFLYVFVVFVSGTIISSRFRSSINNDIKVEP